MNTHFIDSFLGGLLNIDDWADVDSSLNGIQVDNDGAEVQKIAFAVDASLETIKKAAEANAGMLFVHHGFFWGSPLRIKGGFRASIDHLLKHNIALYAAHLPLDQHPELGNNAVLAELLGIENKVPFGICMGRKVGWKGNLKTPLTIDEAFKRISFMGRPPTALLSFSKKENKTCAVISGGAAMEAAQAIDEGIDMYVTGEAAHSIYHTVEEAGLNMVCGGHYNTEVWGVQKVMQKCKADLKIDVEFLDVPTGL
ncbi:GTP cyclohydrolase 1 type 2 [Spirochaetia bacterium]|nr:GTP cyclohydrolase 1 type 2 [Spirochaetia bacterium]